MQTPLGQEGKRQGRELELRAGPPLPLNLARVFVGSHFKRLLALRLLPLFLLNLHDTEENINVVFILAKILLTLLFGPFWIVDYRGVAHMPLEQTHKGPQSKLRLKDMRFFLTFAFLPNLHPKACSDFFIIMFSVTSMHTKFNH